MSWSEHPHYRGNTTQTILFVLLVVLTAFMLFYMQKHTKTVEPHKLTVIV